MIAMITTTAIAPKVPTLPTASTEVCEVTEDEVEATGGGRTMVVAVLLEEELDVELLIIIVDAGKLSSTVAYPDARRVGPLTYMKTK
jgi:hypothetical protein